MSETISGRQSKRVFLAAVLLGALTTGNAKTSSWLLGRWELKFDPDGSPKDFIEFYDGGQVVSISEQGRRVSGAYMIQEEGVKVSFLLPNGKTFPLTFFPTQDRRQLKVKSSKTGNVAVYEKVRA